ncbi:MAG TPA: alpha-ketoacid dehydrogenase subunit beta, partial [Aestuariivirga sp.]|nr:alpha-ketoacid dehydrogenase subunit beta [Aestuariivirga sp.]
MPVIETTYREALRQSLIDAMNEDPSIIIMGEEVGRYGGAYGVTKGMLEMFGENRVIDTPISEPGIVGAGIGAAMTGLRPVVELMYVDFAGLTMDQMANQAAKSRYMFGGQIGVPMVLRSQGGTGRSGAAQHSQSLESWFTHVPGLRVVMPATVSDAYHLLRMALTKPDPVVFLEHKGLYVKKGELDVAKPEGEWGKSVIRRQGSDLTIVTYSKMVFESLSAAVDLSAQGVEAEVIDIRTLNPLDDETIIASVAKTGRAIVVTESVLTGGFAAELSARISERCFEYLEEPVLRVSGEDIPIPVSPSLER